MAEPALYFGIIGKLVLFLYLRMPSNIYHIKVVSFFSIKKKIFFIILSLYLNFLVQLKCSIKKHISFCIVFPLYIDIGMLNEYLYMHP